MSVITRIPERCPSFKHECRRSVRCKRSRSSFENVKFRNVFLLTHDVLIRTLHYIHYDGINTVYL